VTLIPDASVIAKLYFPEERRELAYALLADADRTGEQLLAPHILASELVNIARRKMRRDGVSLDDAAEAIDRFLRLPIEYRAEPEIYRGAILLTERYSLSGFDAQYVALAQLVGCDLWVDDDRMLNAIAGRLRFVRRLADYRPSGT
jgi:predicted nucleic acid-binding protein